MFYSPKRCLRCVFYIRWKNIGLERVLSTFISSAGNIHSSS